MNPCYWGPAGWRFIEAVVRGFDEREQSVERLVRWIDTLPAVLPCAECRENFAKTLRRVGDTRAWMQDASGRLEWFRRVRVEVRRHERPCRTRGAALVFCALLLLVLLLVLALLLFKR